MTFVARGARGGTGAARGRIAFVHGAGGRDPIDEAIEVLLRDHATAAERDGRTVRLVEPVRGDPGFAVLRVLGLAQDATAVGAAARGGGGVAAGVWRRPELYLARWAGGRRRVVAYRLTGGSRPHDYVRTEGRIPTGLETGNWYGPVPGPVAEAFLDVGLLLDDPPFPVAAPPPPAPAPPPPPRAAPRPGRPPTRRPSPGGAEKAKGPRRPPAKPKPGLTTQLCPSCSMHKAIGQFLPGSDVCVDCR